MPPRLRRSLLILGASWLIFSSAWIARRWWAVQVLHAAEDAGKATTIWDTPSWLPDPSLRKWSKLWPTSRLKELSLTLYDTNVQALARAVRVCGPVEVLYVGDGGDGDAGQTFLAKLGAQRKLTSLELANVSLEDEKLAAILSQFPELNQLHLGSLRISGPRFPALLGQSSKLRTLRLSYVEFSGPQSFTLPNLEEAFFEGTPLSDAGLAALLHSPALLTCWLVETSITPAGLRQLPQWKQPRLRGFTYGGFDAQSGEFLKLQPSLQKACPEVRIGAAPKLPHAIAL
jgi:hypothetical protein